MDNEQILVEKESQPIDTLGPKTCVPCRGAEPTFTEAEIAAYQPQVPDWTLVERNAIRELERTFKFPDFKQALAFPNLVWALA